MPLITIAVESSWVWSHRAMLPAPTKVTGANPVVTVTAVTSPLVETVATAEALVVQVTVRPPSGLPLASSGVAVSCTVVPTCTLAGAGLTVTEATGTGTVIAELPVFPSLVAVIVTEPAATAVTRPLLDTVATAVLPLTHVTARPVSGFPFASSGVAVSCGVGPTATVADAGVTVSDATGTGTVVAGLALVPSLAA